MKYFKSNGSNALHQVRNSAGYTLLDALLQLAILMMCLNMMLLFAPFLSKLQHYIVPESMLWERFVTMLAKDLENSTVVQVEGTQELHYDYAAKDDKKRIILRDEIVSATFLRAGGPIVLLTDVKTINYKIEDDKLYVQLQFTTTPTAREATIMLPAAAKWTRVAVFNKPRIFNDRYIVRDDYNPVVYDVFRNDWQLSFSWTAAHWTTNDDNATIPHKMNRKIFPSFHDIL